MENPMETSCGLIETKYTQKGVCHAKKKDYYLLDRYINNN